MTALSNAEIAAEAQTDRLTKGDIVIQTKGQQRGRVGYVAYTLPDRVRVSWVTKRYVLPRVSYVGNLRLVTIEQGARISVDIKPATLARYGAARVSEQLLGEWRHRRAEIDLDDSLDWGEKHAEKKALREYVMRQAEPVDFG